MTNVADQLFALRQTPGCCDMKFGVKTLAIKECLGCRSQWVAENFSADVGNQINFTKITVTYCPICAEDFAQEIDRPTYRRDGGKRIR